MPAVRRPLIYFWLLLTVKYWSRGMRHTAPSSIPPLLPKPQTMGILPLALAHSKSPPPFPLLPSHCCRYPATSFAVPSPRHCRYCCFSLSPPCSCCPRPLAVATKQGLLRRHLHRAAAVVVADWCRRRLCYCRCPTVIAASSLHPKLLRFFFLATSHSCLCHCWFSVLLPQPFLSVMPIALLMLPPFPLLLPWSLVMWHCHWWLSTLLPKPLPSLIPFVPALLPQAVAAVTALRSPTADVVIFGCCRCPPNEASSGSAFPSLIPFRPCLLAAGPSRVVVPWGNHSLHMHNPCPNLCHQLQVFLMWPVSSSSS